LTVLNVGEEGQVPGGGPSPPLRPQPFADQARRPTRPAPRGESGGIHGRRRAAIRALAYAIVNRRDHQVKFGFGGNPRDRLRQFQTTHGHELDLLLVWDGDGEYTEKDLHARFAASRCRGEWYDITPDVGAFLNEQMRYPGFDAVRVRR